MSANGYSAAELARSIQAFGHPVVVSRNELLVAVNKPMLELLGCTEADVLGRPFEVFLPPEERLRLLERARALRSKSQPLPVRWGTILKTLDGRSVPLHVETRVHPGEDGVALVVASCFQVSHEPAAAALAELLVRISSAWLQERTEAGIRDVALRVFIHSGLWAGFYRLEGDRFVEIACPGEAPLPLDPSFAREALHAQTPVFAGSGAEVTHVFVPVARGGASVELLVLFGPFEAGQSAALTLFAKHLAAAYDNARLLSDLEARDHQNLLLLDLARTTAGTLETSAILDTACDFLVRLLDLSNCFILLYDEARDALLGSAASASVRAGFEQVVLELDAESLAAYVGRTRRPAMVEDVAHPSLPFNRALVERFGEKALFAFPMVAREHLMGVVLLDDTRAPRRLSPELFALAQATVGQISLSVANAKLYQSLRESYAVLADARAAMVKRERLAALGELSAVVAHEVRNPLGVIFNAVGTLRHLLPPAGDASTLVDILAEESDRLNRLVGELLDFARPRELDLQPEDVGKLLQEAVEAAQSDPQRGAGVRYEVSVEPGLPPVPLDRRLIRQAVINVALNAGQAMPRGGTVRISARKELRAGRSCLRIDLLDDGPGIRPEVVPRIFEPFFTTKAKGTGLGLAVVKRIVEDHTGEVEVSSALGRGTTFTVRLPIDHRARLGVEVQKP